MAENEEQGQGSIWASRASPEASALKAFAPRRARAGTLPSRLPSRIDTAAAAMPPSSHLGSLALISPDGNDIVYDSSMPTQGSRSAVGQRPTHSHSPPGNRSSESLASSDKHRSPPLAPIPEPTSVRSVGRTNSPLAQQQTQQQTQQFPGTNSLAPPASSNFGRARSGSLNSLAMRTQNYHPYGTSIWSSTTPGSSSSSSARSPMHPLASSPAAAPSIHLTSSGSPTGSSLASNGSGYQSSDMTDPMVLFSNEINKTANPNRMRAYTLEGGAGISDAYSMGFAVGSAPGSVPALNSGLGSAPNSLLNGQNEWAPPPSAPRFAQRARAQTLMPPGAGLAGPQHVPLSRFGQPGNGLLGNSTGEPSAELYVTGEFSPTPTPAICISNVPLQATQLTLHSLFGPFGKIESACVVAPRRCAYVVFTSTIQAIEAQATANGAELYVGNGPSTVSFMQVASAGGLNKSTEYPGYTNSMLGAYHHNGVSNGVPTGVPTGVSNGVSNGGVPNGVPNGVPSSAPNGLAASLSKSSSLSTSNLGSTPSASHSSVPRQIPSPVNFGARHISPDSAQASGGGAATGGAAPVMVDNAVPLPATSSPAPVSVAYILQTLNADRNEITSGIDHLRRASVLVFDEPIKPLSASLMTDPGTGDRTYNAAVLRDLRRRLETMLPKEVEEVALDMQRELPALASDYIGNTTVQLVFERSGHEVRDMMLRRLVDVFAATGTHKNGTWAVQKMIDLARGPRQYALIENAIRPHLVALLLDQFGNYVVQGCLKFGTPYSDFVYSGIASSLPKIAPNRFGARAIRAVLESEHTTAANQRLVATAIVQQIAVLAINPNGCLLVSWLLDNFERSDPDMHLRTHALVAAQLVPQHLAAMCCSKLGSGIVLKLASSPSSSSHRVFDALLEPLTDKPPAILVEVLEDQTGQGASCIYRLMTTVFSLQSLERQVTVNKVRMCLLRRGARIPNHKRLLEEVGLSMLHPEVKEAASTSDAAGTAASNTATSGTAEGESPPLELPVIHAANTPSIEHSALG